MLRYTVLVSLEDGTYIVDVPALPGCHTVGDTLAEAIDNAREAIAAYLEALEARGEAIPTDVETQAIRVDVASPRAA